MYATTTVPIGADVPLDERALVRRYQAGDLGARRALVERMLPLVRSIARRYANRGESLDDLVQVGALGLIKAIDRFDLDRHVRLATFATPTIAGEIKRHFRDRAWAVRVPRDVQELSARTSASAERLTALLGRAPTLAELAQATGAAQEQVREALHAAQSAYASGSLDELDQDQHSGHEPLGTSDDGFARVERLLLLRGGFDALDARERDIVRLRFYGELTQSEIAERVGLSQMHVSRLLRRALAQMRAGIDGDAAPGATQDAAMRPQLSS